MHHHLAKDHVEPGDAARGQLMDQVMPGVEQAREDPGVLTEHERALAPIPGRDHAQHVVALGRGKTCLLLSGLEPDLGGAKDDPEQPRRAKNSAQPHAEQQHWLIEDGIRLLNG